MVTISYSILLLTCPLLYLSGITAAFQFLSMSASPLWKLLVPDEVKVIGGRPAMPGEFPFQVLINSHKGKGSLFCGGSIISQHFILTAAHCVLGMDYLLLHIDTTNAVNQPNHPVFQIAPKDIIIHENYNRPFMKNDIALVFVKYAISSFSENVKTVRLPKYYHRDANTLDNYTGRISGWGKAHDRARNGEDNLLTARIHVMPFCQCKMFFCENYYELDETQICTSFLGSGACDGDSGGGLIITEKDGIDTIIGIVSFGTPSCEDGSPGVYTNVAAFLTWIHNHTGINIRKY